MKIKKLHCCCICFFFMFAVLKVSAQAVIWSPDSPVNVKIFAESEKEAQLANGNELLKTLRSYVSKPNEEKVLVVDADCQFSGSGSFSLTRLCKTKIVGAEGKNVTFWFDAPHIYGVQLNNCENITFENITFDCDPVPFTQGKVIAKNSNSSLLLEPMKGYETLISNPNGTFIIFDPNGDFKLHGHRTCTISQNGDKTLSLTNGNFDIVEVGDYISMPSRTGSMLSLSGCKKIVFNDVRVYASGGMCCVASGGEGGHEFHHFIATRRPGTNRLYAFGADGFHMNELANGPVIEDSEMSYTADDLINIHGRFGWVCSRNNNSKTHLRILCSAGAIKVGQEIDFWDNVTQQYRGKATVESLTRVSNATEIAEAKKDVIQYLDGSIYDIVLSNEVEADKASLIEHHANVCSGFVVRNCKLHDTFNRGFLINGASDGIIENNIVQNVGSGQSFHMETWIYGEGQYINNLIVRNNTFKKAGALWFSTVPPGGNSFYGAFRSTPMRNIQLIGNHIELSEGEIAGITTTYIDGLKIIDNTVVRSLSDQDWKNEDNVQFVEGYGKSIESAIFTTACKNVEISGNQIDELVDNSAQKIAYGTQVENITIDGIKQPNSVADVLSGWFFNGEQEDQGWSYGYADGNIVRAGQYKASDFIPLPYYTGTSWRPAKDLYSPVVSKQTATPGSERSAVIRWKSTVNGRLKMVGKIVPKLASSGDKVNCLIYVDGVEKSKFDTADGVIAIDLDLGMVKEGSLIDFVIDSKGNASNDQTTFNYKFLSDNAPVGIEDESMILIPDFRIYEGVLYIDKMIGDSIRLSVYQVDGSVIIDKDIYTTPYQLPLEAGMYLVRVNNHIKKVII